MSDDSFHSKEMLFVSILSALLGGTASALLMSKEGKILRDNVEETYLKVKENIDEVLHSLEKKQGECLDEMSEEWSENVAQKIDQVRKQMASINPLEPKDLGIVILLFTILGAVLGAGTTLMIQDKRRDKEDLFHGIASRLSSAQPLLSELRSLLNNYSKPSSSEPVDRPKAGATNDLLEFAVLGLKLWDRIKRRNQ